MNTNENTHNMHETFNSDVKNMKNNEIEKEAVKQINENFNENTKDNELKLQDNKEIFEFLLDDTKIANFMERLGKTESKISNMKEMIKSQENDDIYEKGHLMISKLDKNLQKTQERFFKNKDHIDEEIKAECDMKTLETLTMNQILTTENHQLKENLALKAKNYNILLNDFRLLQMKNSQNEVKISQMDDIITEKNNKIEELQRQIEALLNNQQKVVQSIVNAPSSQDMKTPANQEEVISSPSHNNEQNINFIENGIQQVFVTEDSTTKKENNEEKEIKKLELDDSLWLVAKEKEISFELKDFLEKQILPPQTGIKKLPPILSKSQQLYVRQQKIKQPIDRKKIRENVAVKVKSNNTKSISQTPIINAKEPEFMSPQTNKVDETAEVLKLFNSHYSIKSIKSQNKINQEKILPANISNTSLFSHKDLNKDKNPQLFNNSKASFTKVKGLSVQESIRKDETGVGIFNYNK